MSENIKHYLFTIFCTLILMFWIYALEIKVNDLEEKVRIQRVEIDSLVKNKAWVEKWLNTKFVNSLMATEKNGIKSRKKYF